MLALTLTATAYGGGSASVHLIGGKGSGPRTDRVPEPVATRLYGGGA